MADITVTAARVARGDPNTDFVQSGYLAAATTAGQVLYQNASGAWALADGSATGTAQARAIAMTGGSAGQSVTLLMKGYVEGLDLSGVGYDARLYLSDTAGALADAVGTVTVTLGRVLAQPNDPERSKLFFFVGADFRVQYT